MNGSLFRIFEVLKKHDVPFIIIGGFAVNFHGYIRGTEDVDIIFLRSESSESSLLSALKSMNAYWISNEKDPLTGLERTHPVTSVFIKSTHIMMLGTDYGFLDIYDFIPKHEDINISELFDSSIESGGFRYINREWLLKLKKLAGRSKDILDIENLSLT